MSELNGREQTLSSGGVCFGLCLLFFFSWQSWNCHRDYDDSIDIIRVSGGLGEQSGVRVFFDGVPKGVFVRGAGIGNYTWFLDGRVLHIPCGDGIDRLKGHYIQVYWHSGSRFIPSSYCRN